MVSLATEENVSIGIGEYLNVMQHFILFGLLSNWKE